MMKQFIVVMMVLIALSAVSLAQSSDPEPTSDSDFFELLYSKISDIISPGAGQAGSGKPNEVFLMEMPGLAIGREDFDADYWADNNFGGRSPAAVLADFVDRLPRYWDVTFVDSGTRVSSMWKNLMRQYLVPVIDDPVQAAAVENARQTLENSTLEEDFFEALDDYESALQTSVASREACLYGPTSDPAICSQTLIPDSLRVRMAWFSMETRRRDLLGAHATILALQMQDLKTLYAEALATFETSKRIDTGSEGFGLEFYQTFATPSNFWQWWPLSSYAYDVVLAGSAAETFSWAAVDPDLVVTAPNITVQPRNAIVTADNTNFEVTPNAGFSGGDSFTLDPDNTGTNLRIITIGITGPAAASADSAFVKVTASSSESSSSSSYSTSSLSVSARVRVNYGLFSLKGGFDYSTSSSQSSFSSSSSQSSMAFEIAKVSINRPWLDTSLLTYKPVAIRGLLPGEWSDGSGRPSTSTKIRFPLLPTAFIVGRNIEMSSEDWGSLATAASSATSSDSSLKVSYGPFFSGSAKVSTSSSNRESHQSSSFSSNTLSIPGPQVIGWVCQPMPFFPTAASSTVEKINFGQVLTNTFSAA